MAAAAPEGTSLASYFCSPYGMRGSITFNSRRSCIISPLSPTHHRELTSFLLNGNPDSEETARKVDALIRQASQMPPWSMYLIHLLEPRESNDEKKLIGFFRIGPDGENGFLRFDASIQEAYRGQKIMTAVSEWIKKHFLLRMCARKATLPIFNEGEESIGESPLLRTTVRILAPPNERMYAHLKKTGFYLAEHTEQQAMYQVPVMRILIQQIQGLIDLAEQLFARFLSSENPYANPIARARYFSAEAARAILRHQKRFPQADKIALHEHNLTRGHTFCKKALSALKDLKYRAFLQEDSAKRVFFLSDLTELTNAFEDSNLEQ